MSRVLPHLWPTRTHPTFGPTWAFSTASHETSETRHPAGSGLRTFKPNAQFEAWDLCSRYESPQKQADRCYLDHGLAGLHPTLAVFTQPAAQPAERPLHDPSFG